MRMRSLALVAPAVAACGSASTQSPSTTGAAGAGGVSGASQAGASGSGGAMAGAAGAMALAGSGGAPKNPSSCKLVHEQDQPCKEEGLVCEFPGTCNVVHECKGGGWQISQQGDACCPSTTPTNGDACPVLGVVCVFDTTAARCEAAGWAVDAGGAGGAGAG